MRLLTLLLSLSLLSRTSAAGFSSIQVNELGKFIENFNGNVVAVVGVLLMSLAIIAFFAGLVRFIWSIKEGEAKRADEGKKFMLWSLLAIFIIFSLYGIIYFMQQTLGIGSKTTLAKPCLNLVTDCKGGAASGLPSTQANPNVSGNATVQTSAAACIGKQGSEGCVLNGSAGTCKVVSGDYICVPNSGSPFGNSGPCESLALTSVCTTTTGARGTCQMVGSSRFCVGDFSSTGDVNNSNVAACSYATVGKSCENGAGVCKSGQNGAYCDTRSTQSNVQYYDCTNEVNDGRKCAKNKVEGVCSYAPGDGYCKVQIISIPDDPTQGASAY